jgi:hypothetical protein
LNINSKETGKFKDIECNSESFKTADVYTCIISPEFEQFNSCNQIYKTSSDVFTVII